MTTRRHRLLKGLAVAASAFSAVLLVAVGVLAALLAIDPTYEGATLVAAPDILMALAFVLVGAVVTIRRPESLVGWSLTLAAVGFLAGGVLGGYAELALLEKPEAGLPGGTAAAAVAAGSWTPLMAGVFLLLLSFPTGRLPSRRWRPVAAVVLAGFAAVWLAILSAHGQLEAPFEAFENPLALTDNDNYLELIYVLVVPCLGGVVAAAVNLLLRFRRSRGIERQQFKWLAGSAGLLLVTLPFAAVFNYSGVAGFFMSVALVALPVSVGIAVLRYRLYEIDRLVNRALVYGAVSALLAGLYFGVVISLQEAFSGLTRGNDLAIAGSTLAVAALFRPARARIQEFVDRRFYRRRYDAEQTLGAFNARLRQEIDLGELGSDLGAVVRDTMQPTHLSLWIRPVIHTVTAPVTISGRSGDRKDSR